MRVGYKTVCCILTFLRTYQLHRVSCCMIKECSSISSGHLYFVSIDQIVFLSVTVFFYSVIYSDKYSFSKPGSSNYLKSCLEVENSFLKMQQSNGGWCDLVDGWMVRITNA